MNNRTAYTAMKPIIRASSILCMIVLSALSAKAQTPVSISPMPRLQFFNASGQPLSGGQIFTYTSGTSTPQATYADSTGTSQLPNPIVLDSGGSAQIWLASGLIYRFVVKDSSGSQQWTVDGVQGPPNLLAPGPIGTTIPNIVEATQFLTSSPSPALSGIIRLASGDQICWRNSVGSADVCLSKNSSDVFFFSSLSVYQLNNVQYIDGTHYPCSSTGLNAAITVLPSAGGIVDARGCQGTNTISATVSIGAVGKTVKLLLDKSTNWNCTITNNTDCFDIYPNSSLIVDGETQTPGGVGGISLSASASVQAVIATPSQGGPNAGFTIENPTIQGNATATISKAAVYLVNPLQIGEIKGLAVGGFTSTNLLEITQTAANAVGPITFDNVDIDCVGLTGCKPILIQGVSSGGVMAGISFFGGVAAHPGSSPHIIADLEGITGNECAGVNFYGMQLESSNATDIGINIDNCTSVNIDGLITSAVIPGADVVKISGSNTDGVFVKALNNFDLWTNDINNTVNSNTITGVSNLRLGFYGYNATSRPAAISLDGPSANGVSLDQTGVKAINITDSALSTGCVNNTSGLLGSTVPCGPPVSALQTATISNGTSISASTATSLATVTINKPATCTWRIVAGYSFSWGTGTNQAHVSSAIWDGTTAWLPADSGSSNGTSGGYASNSAAGISVPTYSSSTASVTLNLYAQSTTTTAPTTIGSTGVSFSTPISGAVPFYLTAYGVCMN